MDKKKIGMIGGVIVALIAIAIYWMRPTSVSTTKNIPQSQSVVIIPPKAAVDPATTPDQVIAGNNQDTSNKKRDQEATIVSPPLTTQDQETPVTAIEREAPSSKGEKVATYGSVCYSDKFYKSVANNTGIISSLSSGEKIDIFWFLSGEKPVIKITGIVQMFTFPGGKQGFSVWAPSLLEKEFKKDGEMFVKSKGVYAKIGSPRTYKDGKKFYLIF